jgi:hypothetical protein
VELSFLGATGTVTASKYLLRAAGRSLMLDCGLFQEQGLPHRWCVGRARRIRRGRARSVARGRRVRSKA